MAELLLSGLGVIADPFMLMNNDVAILTIIFRITGPGLIAALAAGCHNYFRIIEYHLLSFGGFIRFLHFSFSFFLCIYIIPFWKRRINFS